MSIPPTIINIQRITQLQCRELCDELMEDKKDIKYVRFILLLKTETHVEIIKQELQENGFEKIIVKNNVGYGRATAGKMTCQKPISLQSNELWEHIVFLRDISALYAADFQTIEIE